MSSSPFWSGGVSCAGDCQLDELLALIAKQKEEGETLERQRHAKTAVNALLARENDQQRQRLAALSTQREDAQRQAAAATAKADQKEDEANRAKSESQEWALKLANLRHCVKEEEKAHLGRVEAVLDAASAAMDDVKGTAEMLAQLGLTDAGGGDQNEAAALNEAINDLKVKRQLLLDEMDQPGEDLAAGEADAAMVAHHQALALDVSHLKKRLEELIEELQ